MAMAIEMPGVNSIDYHDHQNNQDSSASNASQGSASKPAMTSEGLMQMMTAQFEERFKRTEDGIRQLRQENKQLRNADVERTAQIATLTKNMELLTHQNTLLKTQLDKVTEERDNAREERDSTRKECDTLKKEKEEDRRRILQLETERNQLLLENENLKQRLRVTRAELEEFRMRHEPLTVWFDGYQNHLRSVVESSMAFVSALDLENQDSPLIDKITLLPMSDPRRLPGQGGHTLDSSTIHMILEKAKSEEREPVNPFTAEKLPAVFSDENYHKDHALCGVLEAYSRCGLFGTQIRKARAHVQILPKIFQEIKDQSGRQSRSSTSSSGGNI
jgi:hypothetical protein